MHAVCAQWNNTSGALLQVHVVSFGNVSRTSTTAALDHWVSDAVALVPLLVMLILRTGACALGPNASCVEQDSLPSASFMQYTQLYEGMCTFSDPEAVVQNLGTCPQRRQPTGGSNA